MNPACPARGSAIRVAGPEAPWYARGVALIRFAAGSVRQGAGGRLSFEVPRFGRECICCNRDARGVTQPYNASTDTVSAPPILMPVCVDCLPHATQTHTAGIVLGGALCVGLAATGLGLGKLGERPDDTFLWGMAAFGIALTTLVVILVVRATRRERRERAIAGHHPRASFSIDRGHTHLATTNPALVERLLALNPGAERVLTRKERKELRASLELPRARVVRRDD